MYLTGRVCVCLACLGPWVQSPAMQNQKANTCFEVPCFGYDTKQLVPTPSESLLHVLCPMCVLLGETEEKTTSYLRMGSGEK